MFLSVHALSWDAVFVRTGYKFGYCGRSDICVRWFLVGWRRLMSCNPFLFRKVMNCMKCFFVMVLFVHALSVDVVSVRTGYKLGSCERSDLCARLFFIWLETWDVG